MIQSEHSVVAEHLREHQISTALEVTRGMACEIRKRFQDELPNVYDETFIYFTTEFLVLETAQAYIDIIKYDLGIEAPHKSPIIFEDKQNIIQLVSWSAALHLVEEEPVKDLRSFLDQYAKKTLGDNPILYQGEDSYYLPDSFITFWDQYQDGDLLDAFSTLERSLDINIESFPNTITENFLNFYLMKLRRYTQMLFEKFEERDYIDILTEETPDLTSTRKILEGIYVMINNTRKNNIGTGTQSRTLHNYASQLEEKLKKHMPPKGPIDTDDDWVGWD
jgi:hypothetical protein